MELQLFIKETLVQIANGLIDAQNELKEKDFHINPLSYNEYELSRVDAVNSFRKTQKIKFRVQLEVSESEGTQKGFGAKINVFRANIDSEEKTKSQSTTELEFEVPVSFPHSKIPYSKDSKAYYIS